jgi:beta-xylosidase
VNNKLYEQSNMIHFQVKKFEGTLSLPAHLQPVNNNWTVTGRGTVIARVTWKNMKWTRENEEIYLAFCRNVRDIIEACS